MTEGLKKQAMVKVTGDNMDIYIRTEHQSTERANKDLHMFTSNIIFPRVYCHHLSNEEPTVGPVRIPDILLTQQDKDQLLDAYAVLVGRLLCHNVPAFKWLESVLPNHIPHRQSMYMDKKSNVMPLPIIKKNESKYEDCFDILDAYEQQIVNLFVEAHGTLNHKYQFT